MNYEKVQERNKGSREVTNLRIRLEWGEEGLKRSSYNLKNKPFLCFKLNREWGKISSNSYKKNWGLWLNMYIFFVFRLQLFSRERERERERALFFQLLYVGVNEFYTGKHPRRRWKFTHQTKNLFVLVFSLIKKLLFIYWLNFGA